MSGTHLFTPNTKATVSITAASVSASVALILATGVPSVVRIKNIDTANVAYVEFGSSTVTAVVPAGATPGSMPISPGEAVGVSLGAGQTYAAAICAAGAAPVVLFTPGNGL